MSPHIQYRGSIQYENTARYYLNDGILLVHYISHSKVRIAYWPFQVHLSPLPRAHGDDTFAAQSSRHELYTNASFFERLSRRDATDGPTESCVGDFHGKI